MSLGPLLKLPHGDLKPLTLDFNTFTTSTGLDYNNGAYVAHPSLEAVLDGNYSSTKQVNSIQQLITYSLITGTKVENFGNLPGILSNSNFSKDSSKVTEIELTAHMIVVNNQKDSVSPLPLSAKKKKGKTQTPTDGSEQSHSVSSGTIPDPQDLKRNIQLASMGLPSTLDEGTHKSQPFPEGTTTDPEDSGGNDQPADKGLPSTASHEGTAKTTSRPKGLLGDKDSGGNKPPVDMELINPTVADPSGTGAKYQVDQTQSTRLMYQSLTKNEGEPSYEALQLKTFADVQALLLFDDEMVQESDEEEVFEVGKDMDEDTQADTEVYPDLKKFDNILPLTERQLVKYLRKAAIEGYYEENINHREQTDKVIDAAMNSHDKNSIARGDLLNALNRVIEALKAIQDAVKEDHVLNKKVLEAREAYTKNSTHLTELLTLIKNFDFQRLKKDTSDIKSMMTEIYQSFKVNVEGENVTQADTEEPSFHIEGEHAAMEEEPTNAVPITTVKPTKIPTLEIQPITTIISTSQPEPSVPQREGKAIVTNDQPEDQRKLMPTSKEIQAYLDKEENIKKAAEEAKLFEMTKTEVIKVVQEEAEKIGLDPKKIISAKADELGLIIEKKKNSIVKDLMTSLGKRYERLKKIPEELGIQSALPALVPGQVASQSSGRKRKHIELEPKIKVPGLE
ncbi:hypothetical protein Tco_0514562 [Tanacetum coccineum]